MVLRRKSWWSELGLKCDLEGSSGWSGMMKLGSEGWLRGCHIPKTEEQSVQGNVLAGLQGCPQAWM